MGVLTAFLKEKGEQLRTVQPEREQLVSEWQAAVERLIAQIEQWVREADAERLIQDSRMSHTFNDEKMGPYTAPGLKLDLDGQTVGVEPVARRVVASIQPPGESQPRR